MRLPALDTLEYTPFLLDPHRCAKMEYDLARAGDTIGGGPGDVLVERREGAEESSPRAASPGMTGRRSLTRNCAPSPLELTLAGGYDSIRDCVLETSK